MSKRYRVYIVDDYTRFFISIVNIVDDVDTMSSLYRPHCGVDSVLVIRYVDLMSAHCGVDSVLVIRYVDSMSASIGL